MNERKHAARKILADNGRQYKKRNYKDIGRDGVDWIPLTQENDRWQAFMNTVKKPSDSVKS